VFGFASGKGEHIDTAILHEMLKRFPIAANRIILAIAAHHR
jgi:hypothetical protein